MGFLRIYLALCVVAAHSNGLVPWALHSGREAVQIFFMISGFYMALIADKYSSKLEFYCSRFLRIFIPYWAVAIGVVVFCVISGLVIGEWGVLDLYRGFSTDKNGIAGVLLAGISNVTIFFQDTVMFLTDDGGQSLSFTRDFGASKHPLWLFLVIPQAWSVAVELMFYMVVPFISQYRNRYLFILLMLSLGVRVFSYEALGLTNDPWVYRFFPFEMALFVAGMLSCRFYKTKGEFMQRVIARIVPKGLVGSTIYIAALFCLFFVLKKMTLLFGNSIGENYAVLVSYILWAVLIPFLFVISKSLRWDRVVGELSYPVYLLHVFVISVVGVLLGMLRMSDIWIGKVSALLSVFVASILFVAIIMPLDRRRHVLAKEIADRLRGRIKENIDGRDV